MENPQLAVGCGDLVEVEDVLEDEPDDEPDDEPEDEPDDEESLELDELDDSLDVEVDAPAAESLLAGEDVSDDDCLPRLSLR